MPEFCEYEINGAPWRVGGAEELCARFKLAPELIPKFHAWVETRPDLTIAWSAARLLYKIHPLIPINGDEKFLHEECSIADIASTMGISEDSIKTDFEMLHKSWNHYFSHLPPPPKPPEPAQSLQLVSKDQPTAPDYSDEPLTVEQQALIRRRGFDLDDFRVEKSRTESKRNQEMQWFHSRLTDLDRVFGDPNAKEEARQMVINEMNIRRIDEKILRMKVDDENIDRLLERKQALEKMVIEQRKHIESMCPYIRSAINKINAVMALSEIMEGLRNFWATGDNRLRDAIFTAAEVLVLDRESVQQPSHYRPGWVAYHLEAEAGLFDPNFKSKMPISFCKTLDMAHLIAKKEINERLGVKLPDLLVEGAAGEYPNLPELSDGAGIDMAEELDRSVMDEELMQAPITSVALEEDDATPAEIKST